MLSPMGAVRFGSVEPKTATTGMPRDAAICIGPLSLVINKLHLLMRAMACLRPTSPAKFKPLRPFKTSPQITMSSIPPNKINPAS